MVNRIKFDHLAIHVKDLEKSIDFYTNVLGLKLVESEEGKKRIRGQSVTPWRGDQTYVFLACEGTGDKYIPGEGGGYIELIEDHSRENNKGYEVGEYMKVPHISFVVDDLNEKAKELKKKGAEFLIENAKPTYSKTIKRLDFIKDPEGYRIELMEFY